jgi:hypothetical protein
MTIVTGFGYTYLGAALLTGIGVIFAALLKQQGRRQKVAEMPRNIHHDKLHRKGCHAMSDTPGGLHRWLLLLKKNSLIIFPPSSFRAALHFFFPTSFPRLFTLSIHHSFVVVGLQAAYIHSPSSKYYDSCSNMAQSEPHSDSTYWSMLTSSLANVQN